MGHRSRAINYFANCATFSVALRLSNQYDEFQGENTMTMIERKSVYDAAVIMATAYRNACKATEPTMSQRLNGAVSPLFAVKITHSASAYLRDQLK
jgi:hypothetical protein